MQLQFIICSVGRSGSVYAARLLTSVGIPCGHESIFNCGGIEQARRYLSGELIPQLSHASQMDNRSGSDLEKWTDPSQIVADSSYMAAPFLEEDILKDVPLIHVVRHPCRVVNSFCNYINYFEHEYPSNQYEEFIYKHVPDLTLLKNRYDRACLYYIVWNRMIEKRELFLYHVEDSADALLSFLGKTGPCFSDRSINTFKKRTTETFCVNKISDPAIKRDFIQISEEYGYNSSPEILFL